MEYVLYLRVRVRERRRACSFGGTHVILDLRNTKVPMVSYSTEYGLQHIHILERRLNTYANPCCSSQNSMFEMHICTLYC